MTEVDRIADQLQRSMAGNAWHGPMADAFAHIGQIAMLRRIANAPIRGENYLMAEIVAGRVGPDQASSRREFD